MFTNLLDPLLYDQMTKIDVDIDEFNIGINDIEIINDTISIITNQYDNEMVVD